MIAALASLAVGITGPASDLPELTFLPSVDLVPQASRKESYKSLARFDHAVKASLYNELFNETFRLIGTAETVEKVAYAKSGLQAAGFRYRETATKLYPIAAVRDYGKLNWTPYVAYLAHYRLVAGKLGETLFPLEKLDWITAVTVVDCRNGKTLTLLKEFRVHASSSTPDPLANKIYDTYPMDVNDGAQSFVGGLAGLMAGKIRAHLKTLVYRPL